GRRHYFNTAALVASPRSDDPMRSAHRYGRRLRVFQLPEDRRHLQLTASLAEVDGATREKPEARSKTHLAPLLLDRGSVLTEHITRALRERLEADGQGQGEQDPGTAGSHKTFLEDFVEDSESFHAHVRRLRKIPCFKGVQ